MKRAIAVFGFLITAATIGGAKARLGERVADKQGPVMRVLDCDVG